MPRTSKRKYNYDKELIKGTDIVRNTPDKKAQSSQQGTLFRVAIYGRLSSDHDESGQISQSESLEVQINIVRSHIDTMIGNGERMELHDIYTDMGKTGTNFNRDEFARMMQDVRMGEINCIMVKDLSRFGRDYLEAGNYIEKIFPFLGVRFIAVTDGFDTGQEGHENRKMAMNIK
ncbi:MAG: recombinase family protein, partial [Lachnospiraceae bacterium]|nr:recombinase family protein [Lachnospiraceae bacterium]